MRTLLDITIEGDPVAKGRPRFSRGGHTYTPKKTVDAEKAIRELAAAQVTEPHDGPVGITLAFSCATARRTDGDNLQKLVLDALNGLVYTDDHLVHEWSGALVRKSPTPQTRVVVYTLDTEET